MSIRAINRIWEYSNMDSTELLLLLAIADNANDDNVCYPGIPYLAKKTRKSERQVKRLLQKLEGAGELFVLDRKGGRKSPNLYLVSAGLSEAEIADVLTNQFFKMSQKEAKDIARKLLERQKTATKKGDIQGQKGDIQGQKGDIQGQKGDIAMSPKPINQYNHQKKRGADAPRTPTSISIFREVMGFSPAKTLWPLVAQTIGDAPTDLAFWRDVVTQWLAVGYSKKNIDGMLDKFKKRELPATQPKTPERSNNGAGGFGHTNQSGLTLEEREAQNPEQQREMETVFGLRMNNQ